ncbi:hypothetical protein Vadar_006099 [Vaccinium darrowii]|nr:hypothetical protein Vadar_006099 [Vaccinium darrowii]
MKKELGVLLLLIAITNLPIAQSFDVYFLSLTWPNSYCNVKTAPCQPPVPQNFTIHGLWPGFLSTGGTVKDCPVPALEKKQVAALWKDLEQFWPNLRATDSHFKFWGDEWRKHGSCSGLDPATYFGLAIQFRKAINLLAVLGTEGSYVYLF